MPLHQLASFWIPFNHDQNASLLLNFGMIRGVLGRFAGQMSSFIFSRMSSRVPALRFLRFLRLRARGVGSLRSQAFAKRPQIVRGVFTSVALAVPLRFRQKMSF